MSDDEKNRKAEEAAELAKQARKQAEATGKTTAKLVQKGTGAAAEYAVDELEDVAYKARGTAEDAVHAAAKLDFGRVLSKASAGFLALSAASFCGAVGYRVFTELKNRPNA